MRLLPKNMKCQILAILVRKPHTNNYLTDLKDYEKDLKKRAEKIGVSEDDLRAAMSAS